MNKMRSFCTQEDLLSPSQPEAVVAGDLAVSRPLKKKKLAKLAGAAVSALNSFVNVYGDKVRLLASRPVALDHAMVQYKRAYKHQINQPQCACRPGQMSSYRVQPRYNCQICKGSCCGCWRRV
jgi:hypothetical protein